MKKNIKEVMVVMLLFVITFVGCNKVMAGNAAGPNIGKDVPGNLGGGAGQWEPYLAGIKLNFLDEKGNCNVGIVLVTPRVSIKDYVYYPNIGVRTFHTSDLEWTTADSLKKDTTCKKNLGVINYDFGSNEYNNDLLAHDLATYFQKNNWDNLNQIVNQKICDGNSPEACTLAKSARMIVLEPMARNSVFIGTACEMALGYYNQGYVNSTKNYWFNDSNVLTNIGIGKNGTFWSGNKEYKYGRFASSISISSEKINTLSGEEKKLINNFLDSKHIVLDSFDSNTHIVWTDAMTYWKSYCTGLNGYTNYGIGIFPNPIDPKGFLEIIKNGENKDGTITSLSNTMGLKFNVFKGNNCSGTLVKEVDVPKGRETISLDPGNYSIKEVQTPNYVEDSNKNVCYNDITISVGKTTTKIITNTLKKDGNITIQKIDAETKKLIDNEAGAIESFQYEIYEGENCATSKPIFEHKAILPNEQIKVENLVSEKYYSIKEISAPAGYDLPSNNCTNFQYFVDREIVVTIENKKSNCVKDFENLANKNDMAERAKLYKKYSPLGEKNDINNMLDLSVTDSVLACSHSDKSDKKKLTVGCMTAISNVRSIFNEKNLSAYDEKIYTNYGIGFCIYDISFENNYGSDTTFAYSGRPLFFTKEKTSLFDANLTLTCYIPKTDDSASSIGNVDDFGLEFLTTTDKGRKFYPGSYYYDFGSSEGKVDYAAFNLDFSYGNLSSPIEVSPKLYKLERKINVKHYLPLIYAKNVSGKVPVNDTEIADCENNPKHFCKKIGYGIRTSFNLAATENSNLDFLVGDLKNLKFYEDYRGMCYYNIDEGIVNKENKLNLEFRVVNTNNPFPGKDGNGRKPGDNWTIDSKFLLLRYIETALFDDNDNYTISSLKEDLKTCESLGNTCDKFNESSVYGSSSFSIGLYDDGVVDEKDIQFLDYLISKVGYDAKVVPEIATEEMRNHYFAQFIMDTTNNSYDKNGTGPIYTIYLGKDTINNIRDYNKTHEYDDYTLECDDDGKNCKSTFLRNKISSVVEIKE